MISTKSGGGAVLERSSFPIQKFVCAYCLGCVYQGNQSWISKQVVQYFFLYLKNGTKNFHFPVLGENGRSFPLRLHVRNKNNCKNKGKSYLRTELYWTNLFFRSWKELTPTTIIIHQNSFLLWNLLFLNEKFRLEETILLKVASIIISDDVFKIKW